MSLDYHAIIFDCDGVIVDTETISNRVMFELLNEKGIQISLDTIHQEFTGYTTQHNLDTIEKLAHVKLQDDFVLEYKARFEKHIDQFLAPINGVPELLSKIQSPFAMATNANRKEMDYKLNKIGLIEAFKTRFCVEDVEKGKPAPDMYLKAAEALNVTPSNCIVIEDSVAGITAGVAAGATVFAYSAMVDPADQMKAGATKTFASMKELEALLGL
ncbi:HAD family hydrolase [Marinomonas mediterranea]|jgi:haloacid dehalogenase superfamily, subfamily IA, variant 3 with third motif having DD or ED|uniref:HAD-superfamily hydrolase, subfamily IA, variant 3 n=1 Tax=Marinomonas mediterranea (strain ATCC 700492 / JCM 21426 / NBRC 103028 / MMB-1) TaxID=717774 RepID=F2JZP1_MARM1|nr:HAD family phosphatase [Marinomonas mediterranea]ADZ90895.1 HAD-superfamily hydrolase, subfamily IA, variant 3 [Marinomonas mediterranea MMB-1]WCN08942.1 HAD-IA family hydrolase [Marinomonas mediterranea]WCN17043.1 HAD-IA family hydrolase [Marinomonas mediterranea MMB-1]